MTRFFPLSESTRSMLMAAGLDPDGIAGLVRATVREDLAGGIDVTSHATVDAGTKANAQVVSRQSGVLAGVPVAIAVLEAVIGPERLSVRVRTGDGARVEPGDAVLDVEAPTLPLLTAERSMLNLLCHLAGIASRTRAWADAAGENVRVRDTRKTTPGIRTLEKYAVRCGGGVNHRMGLWDAALVKDNHVVAAGGVVEAFARVRERFPHVPIEVEVDGIDGLREVLAAGADLVLLDNFSCEQMREAVAVRDRVRPGSQLEASGGLTLANARDVAATGVDFIAVGELTHSAPILDLGLDFYS